MTIFFLVELIDIEQSSAELLDERNVREYLQSVAPIPYATGFTFKSKIVEFAKKNGFTIDEYQVFINGDRLFKPYSRKLYEPHNHQRKPTTNSLTLPLKFLKTLMVKSLHGCGMGSANLKNKFLS